MFVVSVAYLHANLDIVLTLPYLQKQKLLTESNEADGIEDGLKLGLAPGQPKGKLRTAMAAKSCYLNSN